jgi:hypothetical protein
MSEAMKLKYLDRANIKTTMKTMEMVDGKINLEFKQLASIIKQLTSSEKMKLNEVIWDDEMEIPKEHQKMVLQRVKKAKANPNRMVPWEKAIKMLKS